MTRLGCLVALQLVGCYFRPEGPDLGDGGTVVEPPNFMFVTSTRYTGAEVADPLVADALCQERAAAATRPGTYMAWVSTEKTMPFTHAKSRFPVSARGWIRTDNRPFVDQLSDLIADPAHIFYPPRKDEFGQDAYVDADFVYTGTDKKGVATGDDCGANTVATGGVADAGGKFWTELENPFQCDNELFRLYCFGIDHNVQVQPPPPPTGAFRAFVTTVPQNVSFAGFNAACDAEGKAAFGASHGFRAFVALTTAPARSILPLAPLPNQPMGWYRADDVAIAADRLFDKFEAPLNVTASKNYVIGDVFTGSVNFDENGLGNCTDWTNPTTSENTSTGNSTRTSTESFKGSHFPDCSDTNKVYCFQVQ